MLKCLQDEFDVVLRTFTDEPTAEDLGRGWRLIGEIERERTMSENMAQIPEKYHGVARRMSAAGIDWVTILAFIKMLLELFSKPKVAAKGHGECCPELAAELLRNRDALVEALCANCCACHHAGCCEDH